jgi:hypothetical protein
MMKTVLVNNNSCRNGKTGMKKVSVQAHSVKRNK